MQTQAGLVLVQTLFWGMTPLPHLQSGTPVQEDMLKTLTLLLDT